MAGDSTGSREWNWGRMLPWTHLFRGFWIAFDFNKLILAAFGILFMAFGWWLFAVIFDAGKPEWKGEDYKAKRFTGDTEAEQLDKAWQKYKRDRKRWSLRFRAAGPADSNERIEAGDLADTRQEHDSLVKLKDSSDQGTIDTELEALYPDKPGTMDDEIVAQKRKIFLQKLERLKANEKRPSGAMRSWPWHEDRGANPVLLVTGRAGETWEKGRFWEWLFTERMPVLLEPLAKLLTPIFFFFQPDIGFVNGLYFLLVILWTIATWSFFGGAITRIAAVQIARDERITLGEALRFTLKRMGRFFTAPLVPIVAVGVFLLVLIVFGLIHMIPWLGEIVDGVLWFVVLIIGLIMALGLVGLVGWPLMSASVSSDGADSWEAINRSYSYVFQAPWQYLWYVIVAVAYGAVLAFFIGLMSSFTVYLGKWGMAQSPLISSAREPSFLFVYAPTSFGWRDLLLSGVQLEDGSYVVDPETGKINPLNYNKYIGADDSYKGSDTLSGFNKFGAALVTFWITVLFLLTLGFSYSYFWSSFTLIYFLLRRKVDDGEMDEIYFEEEDKIYSGPMAPSTPPAGDDGSRSLTVVEPPAGGGAVPSPATPPPPPATPVSTPTPPAEEKPPEPPPSEPSSEEKPPETSEEEKPEEHSEEKPHQDGSEEERQNEEGSDESEPPTDPDEGEEKKDEGHGGYHG